MAVLAVFIVGCSCCDPDSTSAAAGGDGDRVVVGSTRHGARGSGTRGGERDGDGDARPDEVRGGVRLMV